jgi:hypothetical protein
MSAVQESSDAAVEEKQLALTDDGFDQTNCLGAWEDYELKCNLSKQAALSLIIIHWLAHFPANKCFQGGYVGHDYSLAIYDHPYVLLSRNRFGRYQR